MELLHRGIAHHSRRRRQTDRPPQSLLIPVRDDFEAVREAGWTDTEIIEGVLVASLYACANRFSAASGLFADF
jgi:hypothetical protein